MQGSTRMEEASSSSETAVVPNAGASPASPAAVSSPVPAAPADSVQPSQASGCACACGAKPQLVYALGQLGYDLVSEARLDSLVQKMAGQLGVSTPERVLAFDAH